MKQIRVELPFHLKVLAGLPSQEVVLGVEHATLAGVLDALETQYPPLRGTIRDYNTGQRRSLLRFFAEERDISFQSLDEALPESVVEGREALLVIGSVAGG